MFESFPTPENRNNRERMLEQLKTTGIENPDVQEALVAYIEAGEAEVERITDKNEYNKLNIARLIDNAKLFYEAGYVQEAYEDLLETKEIAEQTHQPEQLEKIVVLLSGLELKLQ